MQNISEMISLKEVCSQLKVGRRVITRLIRRREFRCYRITHRYRFAVGDFKHYITIWILTSATGGLVHGFGRKILHVLGVSKASV